jgi:N-acetylglucosaminyldiphosphoundecaprenol N-acetyl-beta-D-mannosaminyltransferase
MATEVYAATGSSRPQPLPSTAHRQIDDEPERKRIGIGTIYVDNVDLSSAVEQIDAFTRSGSAHQVVTVNLDFVSIAAREPSFRTTVNRADLAVADGMPLVWLSRLRGQPLAERVAGVELVVQSCRVAAARGLSVFLLGAAPDVAEAAARRLEAMWPGLKIAGCYSPPMGPLEGEEDERIVSMVKAATPDFLFVALGAPRQDQWIFEHQPELQVPVAMGVGCVFDVLAGSLRRAPQWMQRAGLEWAFRLGQEPHRLWRRYLVNDLPMLARLAMENGGPASPERVTVGP